MTFLMVGVALRGHPSYRISDSYSVSSNSQSICDPVDIVEPRSYQRNLEYPFIVKTN